MKEHRLIPVPENNDIADPSELEKSLKALGIQKQVDDLNKRVTKLESILKDFEVVLKEAKHGS